MEHILKTWPSEFEAVKSGLKTFEWRDCSDRDFQVGDTLLLCKYDPHLTRYCEAEVKVKVTYILRGQFGIPEGYCIMGIQKMEE